MNHTLPDITPEQRANLERLAAYLSTGQTAMRFDMRHFCLDHDAKIYDTTEHACGTAGCAAGHGPAAGIAPEEGEDWDEYTGRCFVKSSPIAPQMWCFAGTWRKTDNTPQGAAARIRYMLTHGVPENWEAQMNGEAELCYGEVTV